MPDKDLFGDKKGHKLKEPGRRGGDVDAASVKATLDFIKNVDPKRFTRKKFFIPSASTVFYVILTIFIMNFFLLSFTANDKTKAVETTTEIVRIEREEVVLLEGENRSGSGTAVGEWWGLSLETSCDGMASYYSGRGFLRDWRVMIKKYNALYSYNGMEEVSLKCPREMGAYGYDCEDMAHASRCLAELYSVNCSFWINEPEGTIVPLKKGHLGICCDTSSGWLCI